MKFPRGQPVFDRLRYLCLNQIASFLLSIVTVVLLARHLGQNGIGQYNYLLSMVSLLGPFVGIGTSAVLIREASRLAPHQTTGLINATLLVRFMGWLLSLAVAGVLVLVVHPGWFLGGSLLVLTILNFAQVLDVVSDLAIAINRLKAITYAKLAVQGGCLLLNVLWVVRGERLAFFVLTQAVSQMTLIFLLFAFLARGFAGFSGFRLEWARSAGLIRQSWPLFGISLAAVVFSRIDQLMIYNMISEEANGLYSVSVRLAEYVQPYLALVGTAMFPYLSKVFVEDRAKYESACRIYGRAHSIPFVSVYLVVHFYGRDILRLLFGEPFEAGGTILVLTLLTVILNYYGGIHSALATIENKQWYVFPLALNAMCVNVVLNLILIPRHGLLGACFAGLCSASVGFLLSCFLPTRNLARLSLISMLPVGIVVVLCWVFSSVFAVTLAALLVLLVSLDLRSDFERFTRHVTVRRSC